MSVLRDNYSRAVSAIGDAHRGAAEFSAAAETQANTEAERMSLNHVTDAERYNMALEESRARGIVNNPQKLHAANREHYRRQSSAKQRSNAQKYAEMRKASPQHVGVPPGPSIAVTTDYSR